MVFSLRCRCEAMSFAALPCASIIATSSSRADRSSKGDASPSIVASSDYEELATLCDRVGIFVKGRLLGFLVGDDVTHSKIAEMCMGRTEEVLEEVSAPDPDTARALADGQPPLAPPFADKPHEIVSTLNAWLVSRPRAAS